MDSAFGGARLGAQARSLSFHGFATSSQRTLSFVGISLYLKFNGTTLWPSDTHRVMAKICMKDHDTTAGNAENVNPAVLEPPGKTFPSGPAGNVTRPLSSRKLNPFPAFFPVI